MNVNIHKKFLHNYVTARYIKKIYSFLPSRSSTRRTRFDSRSDSEFQLNRTSLSVRSYCVKRAFSLITKEDAQRTEDEAFKFLNFEDINIKTHYDSLLQIPDSLHTGITLYLLGLFLNNGKTELPLPQRTGIYFDWASSKLLRLEGAKEYFILSKCFVHKPHRAAEALRLLKLSANLGFAPAQYELANWHFDGRGGVEKDVEEAKRLFALVSDKNFENGQYNLAMRYFKGGNGIVEDETEGLRILNRLALQGNNQALTSLAYLHEDGDFLPKDLSESFRLFKQAAEKGHPEAQYRLSHLYFSGNDIVERNVEEAIRFLKLSSDQGHAAAQNYLGELILVGSHFPKNEKKAFKLFKSSSDSGDSDGQNLLGSLHLARYMKNKSKNESDFYEAIRLFNLSNSRRRNLSAQQNLEKAKEHAPENYTPPLDNLSDVEPDSNSEPTTPKTSNSNSE